MSFVADLHLRVNPPADRGRLALPVGGFSMVSVQIAVACRFDGT
jgi:hypothetical protein